MGYDIVKADALRSGKGAGAISVEELVTFTKAATFSAGATIDNFTLGATAVTSTAAELNILDGATVTANELNVLDDTVITVDIALAASATTDGMDITITMQDGAGVAIDAVHHVEWWISEAATGIGLTADTYSGDVTTGTGTEMEEVTSKKHFRGLTDASGALVATAVDSANPTDQYVAVKHPVTGKVIVSGASGTNWEGV